MTIIQNISLISFQLKYLFSGFQRPLEKRKNGTSGSVRHPVVLHIQSEANIPILGYSVIGQILTGDPHFHNTMFGSTSNGCEKLRPMVIRSTTRLQPWTSGIQGSFICMWPANSPFLFVCIISCTTLPINILICNILRSRAIQQEVNFCSKH